MLKVLVDFTDVPGNVLSLFIDGRDDSTGSSAWFNPPPSREVDVWATQECVDALPRCWVELILFNVAPAAGGAH